MLWTFAEFLSLNRDNAIWSPPMSADMRRKAEMRTPLRMPNPLQRPSCESDTPPQSNCASWFGGMKRWCFPLAICVGPALTLSVSADPPPGDLGQLQQLNRSSESTLRHIQRPSGSPRTMKNQVNRQKLIDRQQRAELLRLQERQRRELLLLNHRARTRPNSGPAHSLRGIDMQSRFQRQQQYKLNRFRLQR